MRNKKTMITLGVAGIAALVAVSLMISFRHKGSGEQVEVKAEKKEDEMGIYYGGSFDEQQFISREYDEESETVALNEVHLDSENSDDENRDEDMNEEDLDESTSEIQRIKEEFENSKPGEIFKVETEGSGESVKLSLMNEAASEENIEEAEENEEIDVLGYQSSGYAEHEVLCETQSREEAESIAGQISGTVLSWEQGTARIQIEDSVDVLLEKLEQQGSNLELHKNYHYSTP